jgi:serine/threonine protein kinase
MEPDNFTEAETKEKEPTPAEMATVIEQDPLAGALLDGRYAIKRKLGQGGFGSVYLASDEKMMSRPVVAKILHVEKIGHDWTHKKFKQEVEAMARIDHPSVVGVLDSGQLADGQPYIVMQYVDGVSLRSLIPVEGMDFARAANIIRQIGKALSAAHERGILHRDLKPENIMLQRLADGDEQVKVIDFGIAKVKDSVVSMSTASNVTAGTAAYMSPEQLCAGPVTAASDTYSFAVIAYEMLTGRRPMNPDSAYQLLELQRSGVRIRPKDLRPNLSEAAEAAILKALSFEGRDRYARAREFGDELAAALSGHDELTRAPAPALAPDRAHESVPSFALLSPALKLILVIATVGLAIVVLAVGGFWYSKRSNTTSAVAPNNPAIVAPVGPERSLTYWLTVQKMLNEKPLGAPIESEGNIIFGNGWKFRLNLRPTQPGALYLINVGPGKNGVDEYNVLFPIPAGKGASPNEKLDAKLAANQTVQLPTTEWYRFVEQTGVEKVWLIWSAQPLPDLDAILNEAAGDRDHPGVIANSNQIAELQNYLKRYDAARPEVVHDKAQKRTLMKGFGDVVVNLIELSHEAN